MDTPEDNTAKTESTPKRDVRELRALEAILEGRVVTSYFGSGLNESDQQVVNGYLDMPARTDVPGLTPRVIVDRVLALDDTSISYEARRDAFQAFRDSGKPGDSAIGEIFVTSEGSEFRVYSKNNENRNVYTTVTIAGDSLAGYSINVGESTTDDEDFDRINPYSALELRVVSRPGSKYGNVSYSTHKVGWEGNTKVTTSMIRSRTVIKD